MGTTPFTELTIDNVSPEARELVGKLKALLGDKLDKPIPQHPKDGPKDPAVTDALNKEAQDLLEIFLPYQNNAPAVNEALILLGIEEKTRSEKPVDLIYPTRLIHPGFLSFKNRAEPLDFELAAKADKLLVDAAHISAEARSELLHTGKRPYDKTGSFGSIYLPRTLPNGKRELYLFQIERLESTSPTYAGLGAGSPGGINDPKRDGNSVSPEGEVKEEFYELAKAKAELMEMAEARHWEEHKIKRLLELVDEIDFMPAASFPDGQHIVNRGWGHYVESFFHAGIVKDEKIQAELFDLLHKLCEKVEYITDARNNVNEEAREVKQGFLFKPLEYIRALLRVHYPHEGAANCAGYDFAATAYGMEPPQLHIRAHNNFVLHDLAKRIGITISSMKLAFDAAIGRLDDLTNPLPEQGKRPDIILPLEEPAVPTVLTNFGYVSAKNNLGAIRERLWEIGVPIVNTDPSIQEKMPLFIMGRSYGWDQVSKEDRLTITDGSRLLLEQQNPATSYTATTLSHVGIDGVRHTQSREINPELDIIGYCAEQLDPKDIATDTVNKVIMTGRTFGENTEFMVDRMIESGGQIVVNGGGNNVMHTLNYAKQRIETELAQGRTPKLSIILMDIEGASRDFAKENPDLFPLAKTPVELRRFAYQGQPQMYQAWNVSFELYDKTKIKNLYVHILDSEESGKQDLELVAQDAYGHQRHIRLNSFKQNGHTYHRTHFFEVCELVGTENAELAIELLQTASQSEGNTNARNIYIEAYKDGSRAALAAYEAYATSKDLTGDERTGIIKQNRLYTLAEAASFVRNPNTFHKIKAANSGAPHLGINDVQIALNGTLAPTQLNSIRPIHGVVSLANARRWALDHNLTRTNVAQVIHKAMFG